MDAEVSKNLRWSWTQRYDDLTDTKLQEIIEEDGKPASSVEGKDDIIANKALSINRRVPDLKVGQKSSLELDRGRISHRIHGNICSRASMRQAISTGAKMGPRRLPYGWSSAENALKGTQAAAKLNLTPAAIHTLQKLQLLVWQKLGTSQRNMMSKSVPTLCGERSCHCIRCGSRFVKVLRRSRNTVSSWGSHHWSSSSWIDQRSFNHHWDGNHCRRDAHTHPRTPTFSEVDVRSLVMYLAF